MSSLFIIGGQWGDEGKGKIVDWFAESYKPYIVARFNGGNNAGHTVVNGRGSFTLHSIPSGIFHKNVKCILGNGMVINPFELLDEIKDLKKRGVSTENILVSDKAHLVMPWHFITEQVQEKIRGKNSLGTTRKGIGPAYADKAARLGIRMGDLISKPIFEARLEEVYKIKKGEVSSINSQLPPFKKIFEDYSKLIFKLRNLVTNTDEIIKESQKKHKKIILEGAQGTLLDLEWGVYDKVTSSLTTRLGAYQGSGLLPENNDRVIGVYKAYITRVGSGYLPTIMAGGVEEELRKAGNEYGSTTGRPRRCGWFDSVLARYTAEKNGLSEIAITKADVLGVLDKVKICVAYKLHGKIINYVPSQEMEFNKCSPVYEELPSWNELGDEVKTFEDLPENMKRYFQRIQKLVGVKISLISLGPSTHQTVLVD